jgi:nitrate/nitrite-specific signal transduction histidine kinase
MADYKDILFENKQELSNEDLLKYLDEKTPEEEKHAIEKKIVDDPFESDALEGLQKINNPQNLKKHVNQLNTRLHQHLLPKKQRNEKGKIKDFQWIILTILLLLFITLIGYGVIALFQ